VRRYIKRNNVMLLAIVFEFLRVVAIVAVKN